MKKMYLLNAIALILISSLFSQNVTLGLGSVNVEAGTVEVTINTAVDVAGFQFDIEGIDLTGGSGGLAEENGFDVYASGDTALGFSLSGTVIAAGSDGILTVLEGAVTGDLCLPFVQDVGPNFDTPIFSDSDGLAYSELAISEGIECDQADIFEDQGIEFSLFETYPNPFNPQLNIAFEVTSHEKVMIKAYDVSGRYIETIYDGFSIADQKKVITWDASELTSGIYIVKMEISNHELTKIVNLIK